MFTKSYRLISVATLVVFLSASSATAMTRTHFFRNAGLAGSAIFSAFDLFNRFLAISELDRQNSDCLNKSCQQSTQTQQTLNRVGLGFSFLPPVALLGAAVAHGLGVPVVTFVATFVALLGGGVEVGTAAAVLDISRRYNAESFILGTPNLGRFIASTALACGSVIFAIMGVTGAILFVPEN